MTALSAALILAIHRLDILRTDLQVVLTLVDSGGVARAEMESAAATVRPAGITGREHQLLILLGRGLSNKEIASKVGVSPQSVKNMLVRIYRKLHVEDRTQAAILAHEMGLVPDLAPTVPIHDWTPKRPAGPRFALGPNGRLGIDPNAPRPLSSRQRGTP